MNYLRKFRNIFSILYLYAAKIIVPDRKTQQRISYRKFILLPAPKRT